MAAHEQFLQLEGSGFAKYGDQLIQLVLIEILNLKDQVCSNQSNSSHLAEQYAPHAGHFCFKSNGYLFTCSFRCCS